MKSNTRLSLLACIWASLLLASRLVAEEPLAGGSIETYSDFEDNFAAGGKIWLLGHPPAPDPLGPAFSRVPVEGDGKYWQFYKVTLWAKGGLTLDAAKQVSIRLHGDPGSLNEHLVDPHGAKVPPGNKLPDIESRTLDLNTGASRVYSAWNQVDHIENGVTHKDYYTVGGTVSYTDYLPVATLPPLRQLETNDVWVRAGHNKKPAEGPMKPPGWYFMNPYGLYDAELGVLRILPATVDGGVTPGDALANASIQEMRFHLNGQDESGAWLFQGGNFALTTPSGEIGMEGVLDIHVSQVDWGDSYGVLNNGSAVDGSHGASPWMNHFNAGLAGNADTGIAGTVYGAPTVWLNPGLDLAQLTHGFTMSTGLFPMQLSVGLSLMELEQAGLAGDYNRDGLVNQGDYDVWRADFGMTNSPADGNGNKIVDAADYTVWRDSLGQSVALGSVAGSASYAAVPEPASAWLLLLGAVVGNWKRRRFAAAIVGR